MSHLSFSEFNEFVQHVTLEASTIINKHFDLNSLNTRRKTDGTLVTDADLTVEKFIREQISLHFENHAILGEEFDDDLKDNHFSWVIDPIDGTYSFANGVPLFGTLIGLLKGGIPLYGSLRLPKLGNELLVGNNEICLRNGKSSKCGDFKSWEDSLILTTDETRISNSTVSGSWNSLKSLGPSLRTWGDCYGYYLLCIGLADVMVDIDLKSYDILPLVPVLKGAGLKIVDFSTKKDLSSIAACKPEIEADIIDIFIKN
jgi:myo-inositol-1(or 4)-monophosphatase